MTQVRPFLTDRELRLRDDIITVDAVRVPALFRPDNRIPADRRDILEIVIAHRPKFRLWRIHIAVINIMPAVPKIVPRRIITTDRDAVFRRTPANRKLAPPDVHTVAPDLNRKGRPTKPLIHR